MNTTDLLSAIDAEVSRLTRIRTLLDDLRDSSLPNTSPTQKASTPGKSAEPKRRGRPKGSKNKATSFTPKEPTPKRRNLSAEGKSRISAGQLDRGAKQKETATAKKSGPALANKAGVQPTVQTKAAPANRFVAPTIRQSVATRKPLRAKKIVAKVGPAKKVVTGNTPKNPLKKLTSTEKRTAKQTPAKAMLPLASPTTSAASETNVTT